MPNLITCPDCGHVVSVHAKECPNCGCPMDYILKANTPKTAAPVKGRTRQDFYSSQSKEEFAFWSFAKRSLSDQEYQLLKKEDRADLFRDQHTPQFWVDRLTDLKQKLEDQTNGKKKAEEAKQSFLSWAKSQLSERDYAILEQQEKSAERTEIEWGQKRIELEQDIAAAQSQRKAIELAEKARDEEQAREEARQAQPAPVFKPIRVQWAEAQSVSEVIVCLSYRFSYLPENPVLTEAQLRYALKDKADIAIYRCGLKALHGHCYRQALIAMQGAGVIGRPVSYCMVSRLNEISAKAVYVEYKAYLVLNGIHQIEQAFRENIIVDQKLYMDSFMKQNPKNAVEVSTLKGLSANFQDAFAQIEEALKDLPEE
jgi:hypothetical protein